MRSSGGYRTHLSHQVIGHVTYTQITHTHTSHSRIECHTTQMVKTPPKHTKPTKRRRTDTQQTGNTRRSLRLKNICLRRLSHTFENTFLSQGRHDVSPRFRRLHTDPCIYEISDFVSKRERKQLFAYIKEHARKFKRSLTEAAGGWAYACIPESRTYTRVHTHAHTAGRDTDTHNPLKMVLRSRTASVHPRSSI